MKQIQNNTTRNGKITWSRRRNSNKIRNKTNTRRSTWKNNEVNRRKLPNENYKPKVHLTEKEKEICNRVVNKFKNFTTKELVDYMHKEKAYTDTKPNEVIDFSYAKFVEI